MVSSSLMVAIFALNLIFMVSAEFTSPPFFGGLISRYPCWWRWYIKQMKRFNPESFYKYKNFQYKESLYEWDEEAIFATPIESVSFVQSHPNITTKMTNDWNDCQSFYGEINCAALIDPRILENDEIRKHVLINKRWNVGKYDKDITVWKGSTGKGQRALSLSHIALNNTDLLQDVLRECITNWKAQRTQPFGGAENGWLSTCEVVFYRMVIDESYIIGHTIFDDPKNAINVHTIKWDQIQDITDEQEQILYWLFHTVQLPLYADFFILNQFKDLQDIKIKMSSSQFYHEFEREVERVGGFQGYKHKARMQAAIHSL